MKVTHGRGSYEIVVTTLDDALSALPTDSVFVTDSNLDRHYGSCLPERRIVVEAGEHSKSFDTYERLLSDLAIMGAKRSTAVVALGGGVVGDLAGFAAATYMRGVPFYQIPTSLLAQVDSAVGGKVGIDLPQGKNLAGAFYQPEKVFIPLEVLQTLPERHFVNGMAEVCKYGLIMDSEFAAELQDERVTAGHLNLRTHIERCLAYKADVVQEDEFETSGRRAILNFGHTIGHAIESALNYEHLLHGEAVAVGMVVESILGERIGVTQPGTSESVKALLQVQSLPTSLPESVTARDLIPFMYRDKKADASGLAFSLLIKVGECKLVRSVPEADVLHALTNL